MLVAPTVHNGAVVGAMYLDSLRRSRQGFTDEDAEFALEVAELITPLIAKLRAAD
jgi:putative methionine-R-sulfoxide reductase with GAF domain